VADVVPSGEIERLRETIEVLSDAARWPAGLSPTDAAAPEPTLAAVTPLVVDHNVRSGLRFGSEGHRFESGHPDHVGPSAPDGGPPACP
jgi:hypothetical protein